MAFRLMVAFALVVSVAWSAPNGGGGTVSGLPGMQTTAGILASSADGASRYFAPDGPIQPAITAIGGLPVRGGELLNNGITRLSSGLNSRAQSLSYSAGQNGQIRMPGMDALESRMPASFAQLGQQMHGLIRQKNNFIRGQAESGIASANRLGQMMSQGLQARSSGGHSSAMSSLMEGPAKMMSSAQEFMVKSSNQIQGQLKRHLSGAMGHMGSMQNMGESVRNQAQGYGRTLSSGAQGVVSQLQQTSQQLMSQIQSNHSKNTQAMGGMLGSLQDGMGSMSRNMQTNFEGVVKHAQGTAEQLGSSLQKVARAPMQVLSQLGSGLGHMMKSGGHQMSSSSSSGRY